MSFYAVFTLWTNNLFSLHPPNFCVFDFWCQPRSHRALLVSAARRGARLEFLAHDSLLETSFFPVSSFFPPSACSPRWRRKIKKHAYPEMPLSISHKPCVVPRGEPWEFKTRIPSQNQEMHHCPPPHLPLSAVRLLCKGPRWLSITPRRAGVAKQPLCIMKRNKRAERQRGQRVNRLRDQTLRSCTATVPSC